MVGTVNGGNYQDKIPWSPSTIDLTTITATTCGGYASQYCTALVPGTLYVDNVETVHLSANERYNLAAGVTGRFKAD